MAFFVGWVIFVWFVKWVVFVWFVTWVVFAWCAEWGVFPWFVKHATPAIVTEWFVGGFFIFVGCGAEAFVGVAGDFGRNTLTPRKQSKQSRVSVGKREYE